MAKALTPQDCYQIMNLIARQATGQSSLQATDASSFVSVGETVLATGMENVFNALNIVLNRLIVASRPYSAKLRLMDAETSGVYSNRVRKVSFFSKDALPDGAHNTQLYTNLADGFTNGQNPDGNGDPQSTKSMWEQHQAMPYEVNFAGSSVWQDCITQYEVQVQAAFRDQAEFARFVAGYMTEHANDIEQQREAFNRMTLLNKIGMTYDMANIMPGSVKNLTKEFNDFYGTAYTSAQLRSTYLKEFLAFMVATIKEDSDFLTERSAMNHFAATKTVGGVSYSILRHTPRDRQRLMLFSPLFRKAEALVLPEIFNPNYLDIDRQYEPITYWQSELQREAINVTPAVFDPSDGTQKAGAAVALDYVVGLLYDVDGMMTDFQLEYSASTPLEARKLFRNVWNTFQRNAINDPTEKTILYIMADYSISLNKSSTTIAVAGTETLTATTTPAGKTVTWTSSDEDIATVTSGGVVTGVASGTAIITGTITVGGQDYSAQCVVTIS